MSLLTAPTPWAPTPAHVEMELKEMVKFVVSLYCFIIKKKTDCLVKQSHLLFSFDKLL